MRGDVVYGVNSVLAALRAGRRPLRRLWLSRDPSRDRRIRELLDLAVQRSVTVERACSSELSRLAGSPQHQGVVAEAETPIIADAETQNSSVLTRL